jgi:two-component system response regulator PrrA
MTDKARLLVIDDDPEITSALARGLALHGYTVDIENRADHALERLLDPTYAAAVVDVMLGEDSGIDLVRTAREQGARLPVVMLSALSDVDHRASGLEAGADDYMVKPFTFDELAARLQVQERRARAMRPTPARLSTRAKTQTTKNPQETLTDREYALLALLTEHAGQPLSRPEILDKLWGEDAGSDNIVDVYVGYLRRKLAPSEDFGFEIKTVRHKGFCLDGLPPDLRA